MLLGFLNLRFGGAWRYFGHELFTAMADVDSDGGETTISGQKFQGEKVERGKRKVKYASDMKGSQGKGGASKPGRAVIVSGGTTQPRFDDIPVNISPDDHDLVMEYPDMCKSSKAVDIIDIQDGDAITESSDTEVVSHTNELRQYGSEDANNASNSDSDTQEALPAVDDDDNDEDRSDGNFEGPPPLDSDEEESSEEQEQLSSSPPEKGSLENVHQEKVQMNRVKHSKDLERESDSDGEIKEAPPPLDSDGDEENYLPSNSNNARNVHAETTVSESQSLPAHNNLVADSDDDNSDDDNGDNDVNDDNDIVDDGDNSDDDYVAAEEQSTTVALETENFDESDDAGESTSLLSPSQSALYNNDDGSDDECDDDETAVLLREKLQVPAAIASVAGSRMGYDDKLTAVTDLCEDDAISGNENSEEEVLHSEQNLPTSSTNKDISEKGSDQDRSESPECAPQQGEEELEWDVEDFDIPKHSSSKLDPEALEVKHLKKSFLDTLKTEAEQTESSPLLENIHNKAPTERRAKTFPGTSKKKSKDTLKTATTEPEKFARKDTKAKTIKTEKKRVKDVLKNNVSKSSEKMQVMGPTSKPGVGKYKPAEKKKIINKNEKHKSEKDKFLVIEDQKGMVEKNAKAKSPADKLPPASVAKLVKEKKKIRPVSEPLPEVSYPKGCKDGANLSNQRGNIEQRSDSDTTSDIVTKRKPQKAQKTSSSESISKQRTTLGGGGVIHQGKPKAAVENGEVKKTKSKRSTTKSIAVGTDNDNDEARVLNRRSDFSRENYSDIQTTANEKLATNDHFSSVHSQDRLSSQVGKHRASEHHRHDSHRHERGKHVWLCRDDEIHKLIAQKASLLKEYESGSLAGRKVFAGYKSSFRNEENVTDLPDVRFVSSKQSRRQTRPMSEAFPERAPYGSRRKEQRRSLQLTYSGSSSDDDDRTNRKAGSKRAGTFTVGLASRSSDHKYNMEESDTEHEETCEFCAAEKASKKAQERNPAWEGPHHPRNLLLGVVYTGKYLGSSQIMSPQAPNKAVRMEQAQEAVGRIKVPEGEDQPTTDVDLFISTERIKVVNASTKEVMLDHVLRTVSFIADIGDVLVLMARQLPDEQANPEVMKPSQILASVGTAQTDHKNIKITCHVFQSPEAQLIAKSIGQAFNVAYQEFLKQNGLSEDVIEDAEYNGVLEAQKILGEDLSLLADESQSKEVIINKKPAEMVGIMIVESGWGSMIPCAIVAHLAKEGPAAKSGRLNVGDQILSVNGTSLVGLPLSECQNIIKSVRPVTKVVMKVVSCPPTVQVVVNRPDTKYQLGFSVQNGMICSLMRGSIAERGGVRVGHRIIDINGESVVATSHQHIVELLATTVGEIRMKTMPASMYRLLVGLEVPQHI